MVLGRWGPHAYNQGKQPIHLIYVEVKLCWIPPLKPPSVLLRYKISIAFVQAL